jgi:NAD(P)-dependent dehydrogenase (short-subunit alcohol dehydrogenase family)
MVSATDRFTCLYVTLRFILERELCHAGVTQSMLDLTGKTVLLTGASKGIGAATARILGEAGAHLVAHYGSDFAGAEEATESIPPERRYLVRGDLAVPGAVDDIWRDAMAWRGRIDVLVNNAAIFLNEGGIDDEEDEWDRIWSATLQINLLAPARFLRNAVRQFRRQDGGIAITISSWNGQRGSTNPRTIAYAASKAAIRAAMQTIARGYAKDRVLAYIIAPGVVRTRLSEQSAATLGGEQAVTATLAMGEWVPPEEIGYLVAFLATGRVRHLTGATLDINGASYVR